MKLNQINEKHILFVVLSLFMLNNIISIPYFRLTYIDEEWVLSMYYNLINNDSPFSLATHKSMTITASIIVAYLYEKLPYLFTGENYIEYRYISTTLGFFVLYFWWKISKETQLSLIERIKFITILASLEIFVFAAHSPRSEIWVMFCMSLGYWIYIMQRNKNIFLTVIACCIGFLGMEAHPIGSLFGFSILGYELTHRESAVIKNVIISISVGISFSVAMFFLNRIDFLDQLITDFYKIEEFRLSFLDRIVWIFDTIQKSKFYRFALYPIILLATIIFCIKKRDYDKNLLIFLVLIFGFYSLGRLSDLYVILLMPWLLLAFVRIVPYYGFYGLLGMMFLFWSLVLYKNGNLNGQVKYLTEIRLAYERCTEENIPVFGPMQTWKAFRDIEFFSNSHFNGSQIESKSYFLIGKPKESFGFYLPCNTFTSEHYGGFGKNNEIILGIVQK